MKYSLLFLIAVFTALQYVVAQVPYGNNPVAGKYCQVGDAQIYYETYGSGEAVVLLHGGLFGYIGEYKNLIPKLSQRFKVISIATRGHGKSEIGNKPFSYEQFAEDTYQVIKQVTSDSVMVIGFSDGANQGYYLAAHHPETIKKFIAIAGNWGAVDFLGKHKQFHDSLSGEYMAKNFSEFVEGRKKLMPEPQRFNEFTDKLAKVWRQPVYVTPQMIAAIRCPTLIAAGQNDGCPVERYVEMFRLLTKGALSIIPNSDHLVLIRKPEIMDVFFLIF